MNPEQILEITSHLETLTGFPRGDINRLDTLAECVKILTAACRTAEQASQITSGYNPRRWHSTAAFAEYVHLQTAAPAPDDWQPPYYGAEETAALRRIAAESSEALWEAYEHLLEASETMLASISAEKRARLLAESADEYRAVMRDYCRGRSEDWAREPHQSTLPPFIEGNARNTALKRIEKHLLLGRPYLNAPG